MIRFLAWTWLGLVAGVSFLATPVKFHAETLARPVALDVGRVTFHALSRVEWVMAAMLLIALVWAARRGRLAAVAWAFAGVIALALIAQGGWLLPALNARVELVLRGEPLPASPAHAIFGVFEALKVLALALLGAHHDRAPRAAADA